MHIDNCQQIVSFFALHFFCSKCKTQCGCINGFVELFIKLINKGYKTLFVTINI
jgi:hypothetical protein